jgi:hypothetical protein
MFKRGRGRPKKVIADMINHPPHYTSGKIECIDYMADVLTPTEFTGYLRGQVIKYNHRLMNKNNSLEDIGKLIWYATKLKEHLAGQ